MRPLRSLALTSGGWPWENSVRVLGFLLFEAYWLGTETEINRQALDREIAGVVPHTAPCRSAQAPGSDGAHVPLGSERPSGKNGFDRNRQDQQDRNRTEADEDSGDIP